MVVSNHARDQMCRRRIRPRHVALALDYGTALNVANATLYVLRKRDVPKEFMRNADVRRAVGTVVVVKGDVVKTAFRNRDPKRFRFRNAT